MSRVGTSPFLSAARDARYGETRERAPLCWRHASRVGKRNGAVKRKGTRCREDCQQRAPRGEYTRILAPGALKVNLTHFDRKWYGNMGLAEIVQKWST